MKRSKYFAEATLFATAFCALSGLAQAQAPSATAPAQSSEAGQAQLAAPSQIPAPVPAPITTSSVLQPSLDSLFQTVTSLKLDKWKRGSVRDEAAENITAIVKDIHTNLPSLLNAADAAPGSITSAVPVVRNVDTLYDVVLRVSEASRVSAPADQVGEIEQALSDLQKARLALYDRMQDTAVLMEKRVSDLDAKVQAQAAFKCPAIPAAPACVAPVPAKKPVRRKPKPPATTKPQTTPAPATKPSS